MTRDRRRPIVSLVAGGAAAIVIAALLLPAGPRPAVPELAAPGDHFSVSAADSANGPVDVGHGVAVGGSQRRSRSLPLRQQTQYPVRALAAGDDGDARGPARQASNAPDGLVQTTTTAAMPATGLNFDGIAYPGVACNCAPPDTNGEVGATQYVQVVNEGFQVWNKTTGASMYGPVGITTIWSGFGGVCQTSGHGDPVVLWDQLAGRWLISEFAGSSIPTDECIAISTSSDATGSWYRYDFHLGSNFYDYPKLAVWPDGYYMSDNVFNSSGTAYLGPQPFVFDRSAMLTGAAATFMTTSSGPLGSGIYPIIPADLDGSTQPAAGAPESFVGWPGAGRYQTYHLHVDWVTPSNSTWTSFASPAAAGFTALCQGTRACVPQSGSSSNLDGLADRLMFRLAYRNFGDHESLVGNYTVSSGGVAGIRWFELRGVSAGPETVYQEGTYQPDSTWRWMGSAAMDQAGDLSIGFSASSASINPQLRYAGRLVGDPLGILAQGEATLFSGTGSQTTTSNRWGDYSDLTVDPVDGCTFWFTSEYYSTTASFNWRTRIGTFSFPSCTGTPPTTGGISGHVSNSSTSAAISGATVAISGGPSTTTDASGNYAFSGLAPTTYSVTASKSGFIASSPTNVVVSAGSTTTQDFALAPAPPTTGNISGKVTNSNGGAAISAATVSISGGASTTTDSLGNYTFTGLNPTTYSLTASKSGFTTSAPASVSVTAGVTTTQNFALAPATGGISGKVTNSNGGAAISAATVSISGGASTTTDSSGNYTFTGQAPTSYSLTASKSGFTTSAPASVSVVAGATTTQNFVLVSTTGIISGKVTNASTAAPISAATVTISGGASTTTDSSGNYTFSGLNPTTYSLTASKAGYTTSAPASVTVSAGVTTAHNFALTPLPILNTGFKFGTTATAVTSSAGDNNGYQSGAANLFSFNGVVATDASSGTGSSQSCTSSLRDKENVSGYSFGLPGTALLKGISVQIRGRSSTTANTPKFCVLLSWNGGTSWTAGKLTPSLSTTLTTYTLGSATDLWGRSWTPANFASSSFRVRIVDLANSTATTFYCDGISVQLTYQ